jgi:fermentation-respiration switch protein FrsA (DUF1100 family)
MNQKAIDQFILGKHPVERFIRGLILVWGCLALLAQPISSLALFPVPPPGYQDSAELIKIKTSSGREIDAFHLTAPEAKFTILYSHGNGEDIGYGKARLEEFVTRGYSIFAYEYLGYGLTEGKPSESKCYESIEAAYRYLTEELKVPPETVLVFGRSLGGGPSTKLLSEQPAAGLILESAFVSTFRVQTRIPLFPGDKFPNLRYMPDIHIPVLFIHGTADGMIAPWHAEALYKKVNEPKTLHWIEGAGHNDLMYKAGESYWEILREFINSLPTG